MRLATMAGHDPTCRSCPACNEEMARILRMTPKEHSRWLTSRRVTPRLLVMRQTGGAHEGVPPPPDITARIRVAAEPSPLKDLMLAGISYDHM